MTSLCKRRYLRSLITMAAAIGLVGYFALNTGHSLPWLQSGTMETRDAQKALVPSKLRLLSYKGILTNQTEPLHPLPPNHSVTNHHMSSVSSTSSAHKGSSPVTTSSSESHVLGLPFDTLPPEKKILIPHIVHQTWDSDMVPAYFSTWIKSWIKFHPDWEYWFWTPKEVKRLIQIVNPRFLKEYNSYKLNIYRANSMRYYIMYYFGGVYADLDLQALKPLDNWTYWQHCILPEETYAHPYLLNKRHRANTMITLLACRPYHPYFKVTIDNLSIYPKLKSSQKLVYVDDMYLKYNKTEEAHKRPENEIYLAHPKYFLPTFDPGWTSKFKTLCSSTYHRSKMFKQQKEVCDDLRSKNFRNQPAPESFTTHHWTHVVMKTETWKRRNTVKISDIVPRVKDVNKVLDDLETEIKELIKKSREQRNSTRSS